MHPGFDIHLLSGAGLLNSNAPAESVLNRQAFVEDANEAVLTD